MRSLLTAAAVLVATASAACASGTTAPTVASEAPLASPHDVGGGLPQGFEPSGAVWQSRLRKLILVGDDGTIASMDADGGSVRTWSLPGDLEGVTVAEPASDRIYVAVERPPSIIEFDLREGLVLRRFPLPGLEGGGGKRNKGLEALTFVPGVTDAEEGAFWAGTQSDGTVHVLSLPPRSDGTSTAARELRRFQPVPGASDLSGLAWDPATKTIWAVFDKENLVVVLDASGSVQSTRSLPGDGQEGIAVSPEWIFIADDSARRVVRYERSQAPADPSVGRK